MNASIGNRQEQLIETLYNFYVETDGVINHFQILREQNSELFLLSKQTNWKQAKGWKDLKKAATGAANGSKAPSAQTCAKILSSLFGVRFDINEGEIRKLCLPFNSLRG